MLKQLLKTMAAVLAIAAAAAGPVRGQTTYNVTFGGFAEPAVNTTVSVASLPQTINFYPFAVISNGSEFISANVTSGGDGKVSVNAGWNQMAITVSGTFEGTATIHVVCSDPQENPVSSDITVACTLPPTPHTVRMAAGTEDAANWTLASGDASVPGNQVLENVMSGSQVTATYNGTTKKVKSVKAVKYVVPAATVTTAPTATAGIIEAGSTTALVNAGAASGGTMMYAVTTTNAQPASTADFSATIPTAEGRSAGTYYVWYYAKADAEHSDSEIAGPVSVTVAEATPALSITSPSVGQVIGSDGKNYAAGASLPTGVTKVAMIAYVSGSNGLAIALADEGSLNWATAISTCEAKTPAFTNGTWHLPSQAEWNQMFSANGGDEESYGGLNTAINTAGGTALLEKGTGYWSSTPDGSKANYVYLIIDVADWRSGNVNLAKQVRACLAF